MKPVSTWWHLIASFAFIFTNPVYSQVNNPDVRILPRSDSTMSEMSIAVSPINNNVLLASANTTNYPINSGPWKGAFWSTDAGLTWQGFYQPPSGTTGTDPVVAIDRNSYFYVGGIANNNGQGVLRSTNMGSTWTYHEIAVPSPPSSLLDKNHLAIDTRVSGTYSGNLYAAWTDKGDGPIYPIKLTHSTDQGVTWSSPQTISGTVAHATQFNTGVNLQVGPNGQVYSAWAVRFDASPFYEIAIGFNKSTDGGVIWGDGTRAINGIKGLTGTNLPEYNIRLNSFPSMAVSQLTGHVFIVWTNIGIPGVNTGDPDIYMIKSTDEGISWSTPMRVNNDPIGNSANQWFPWMTVDPLTDDVSIAFYDGRDHISTNLADVIVAHLNPGGATFDNVVVSDASFAIGPLNWPPPADATYNGDYIGIAARGGKTYPIWNSQVPSANSQGWVSPFTYPSQSQWSNNPAVNNAISTAAGDQYLPTIVSDGSGGAIITWEDWRSANNSDIYAQRINASGVVQWTANGIAVSTAANDQSRPTIVSDGIGGAIITWYDYRGGTTPDIYAQRINASGAVQWTTNGVAISTAANEQLSPTIVSDGIGGAIITWYDNRGSGTSTDIYAQRINGSGTVQWTADGVPISTAAGDEYYPTIISDGIGGAIITWDGHHGGTTYDIYAQRINGSGAVQWTANGVAISTAAGNQFLPTIVSDESGGAIITWQDLRGGTTSDIYAQRINGSGAVQWTADGVPISTAAGDEYSPTIISDGIGGAMMTWENQWYDQFGGANSDIYAQRINGSGAVQWTANGVTISTAAYFQRSPKIVSDGSSGAFITWHDSRRFTTTDIYAQRIDGSGAVQWTANGVAISTAAGNQVEPTIVSDGSGGAIITWQDLRGGGTSDIYASRVFSDGALPIQLASFTASVLTGNIVLIEWITLSELNNYGFEVQRRQNSQQQFQTLPNSFIPGHGTTTEPQYYSYIDSTAHVGTWQYRLKQIDLDGTIHYTDPIQVAIVASTVNASNIPEEFSLEQNYPNPFNPSTVIKYALPKGVHVKLSLFNTLGQRVQVLVDELQQAGYHQIIFDANSLATGIYLYRIQAGEYISTKKFVLLR